MNSTSHQRRKQERPQELLDAALTLFVERGFAATRTDDVAQLAGVSKGTLYLYYPSKEDLLKAVIQHYLGNQISSGDDEARNFDGPTEELLMTVLGSWWKQIYDSPASGVFKLAITEMRNFPDIAEFYRSEVVEQGNRSISAMLQRGIDRGEFRPMDLEQAVHSIVLPLVMLCLHKHSLGVCMPQTCAMDAEKFIQSHLQLLLHGMRSVPAGPAS